MKKYLLTLTLIFLSLYAKGEMTVSTLFTSNDFIRGITLDKEGNLYLALSRSEQSMPIVKFDKNTGDTSVIAYIPRTPKSLVFDQTGNLYIAAYGDVIYCLPKGSKNVVDYVSGIEDAKYGAAGMITDGDTLYFIQQNNHYIYKVLPGGGTVGDTTKIKPIQPIRNAFGSNVYVQDIEWLPDGNLLITTIDGNGPLYKYNIKTKTSTYLGQAPCNSIYDIIRINDSTYLIAGYEKHQIFSLTFDQNGNMNFTPIAGTGTGGYLDGSVSIARFSYPYGLCYNKSSNIIYVNDDYRKKIRIIKDCYPIDLNVQGISNCPYDTASLSATISDTSKVESYLWQGPNGFIAYTKDTSFILTPTLVGRYTFTVKDKLGCTHQQTTALANKVTYSSLNIRTSDSAYTSPSGKYVWTISGQYLDTLTNVYGCDSIITINLKFVRFEPASSYFVTTMSYRPSCVVQGIVFDSKGNMYFSERSSCNSLKKMDAMGNITNIANIPGNPTFMAIDKNDNIYISCYPDKKIVKYSTTSNTWTDYVTNIADSYGPSGIVVVDDTLYFLEYSYQRLFKVKPGGGSFGSSNVIPIQSQVYGITGSWASTVGMDVLPNGNFIVTTYYDEGKVYEVNRLTGASNVLLTLPDNDLVAVTHTPDKKYYVTGYNTNKIYRINADSLTYNVFAGNGYYGTIDGNSYEAEFQNPYGIGVDIEGTFYVSQYSNYALRKISPCNNIQISLSADYKCINDSATIKARVNNWSQVASYKWIGPEGFLSFAKDTTFMLKQMYTGEYTFTVTDIKGCTHRAYTTIYNRNSLVHIYPRVNDSIYTSPSGKKYTKSGLYYDTLTNQYGCDSVIAIHLQIIKPIKDAIYSVSTIAWNSCDVWGITFDKEGNLYYAERHPCNVIKKMDVNGNISDYAYVSGDPVALAFDQQGNLYASCYNSKNVIKIPAGGGTYYSYAWGFTDPYGLDGLIAIGDTLYLCEYSTQRIYKILPGGGSVTSSNVIAIQPRIYGVTDNSCRITGIDVLPDGNLIVATLLDSGLYKVNINTGSSVKLVDVPSFGCGRIVHTDDGYYYFTGYYSNKVYKMHIDSLVVRDFAGSTQGYFDGPALAAMFYNPAGLAISDEGYFIVGDANNRKLRKISPCKNIKFDAIADYGCMGKPVTLHASITDTAAVASYKWTRYNNSLFTNKKDTSFILTYDGLGVYNFVVTDEYGCNLSKSVYINNPTSNSELNINLCGQSSFTSPSGKYVWTQSGIYYDTLVNHLGCDSVIYINLKLAKIDTSITIDGQQIISNESRNYVEYLWLECDNNYKGIKGAYNRTFIPSKTGSYAVMLYYEGCYDTSRCVYIEIIENNVNHPLSKHDWSVYPTTNQGIFTIECPADSKFDIFDYTGRIVLAIKHKGGKRTYHTNLQKGIYFIKDVSGNRKPFIVQ